MPFPAGRFLFSKDKETPNVIRREDRRQPRQRQKINRSPNPAGKAASSRNNTRHGLTAKLFLLDTEDPAQYEALRSDLIDSYRPANGAELMLVEEIAQNFWRLQRARHIEADNMNAGAPLSHPLIKFGCSPVPFDNIRRYMIAIERAWHRAMQQLESMQKIRARQKEARASRNGSRTGSRLRSPAYRVDRTEAATALRNSAAFSSTCGTFRVRTRRSRTTTRPLTTTCCTSDPFSAYTSCE